MNCTESPPTVPNTTRGMSDWDMNNVTYGSIITYFCPEEGWGFPSNGKNEIVSTCQSDKTWNVTTIEECVCEFTPIFKFLKYD